MTAEEQVQANIERCQRDAAFEKKFAFYMLGLTVVLALCSYFFRLHHLFPVSSLCLAISSFIKYSSCNGAAWSHKHTLAMLEQQRKELTNS